MAWFSTLPLLCVVFVVFQSRVFAQEGNILRRNVFSSIAAPSVYTERQGLGKTATATFQVYFSQNFPDSAQQAFRYACDVWSYLLNTTQTIVISASWDSLGEDIGAQASPTGYYPINSDSTIKYPVALAEMILQQNLNASNDTDIHVSVNKDETSWYYGTDGRTPADRVDFVTVIMHEIVYGLGMVGTFVYNPTTYKGSWKGGGYGAIYDYGCIAGNNHGTSSYKLTNTSTYLNPSLDLGSQLVSNNIFFDGLKSYQINGNSCVKLYAPSTYQGGSSIYHLDSAVYKPGTNNSLMGPATPTATAIHSPGEVTLEMLEDLGWSVNRIITFSSPSTGVVFQQGHTFTIKWSDNKGGSLFIQLYKNNGYGTFEPYADVKSAFTGAAPNDSSSWTVSTGYENGEYKLKMLSGFDGYGFSPAFTISNLPTVATPTFTPAAGYYTTTQSVQINCSTPGATIYYTSDRSDPATSSTRVQYTSAKTVDKDMEIHAQAFASNYNPSEVAIGKYYIGEYVPPPTLSWPSGTYPINTRIPVTPAPGITCIYSYCFYSVGGTPCTATDPGPNYFMEWNSGWGSYTQNSDIAVDLKFRSSLFFCVKYSEVIYAAS